MNKVTSEKLRMAIATSIPGTMAGFGRGQMTFYKNHGFDVDYLAANGQDLEYVLEEDVNYFETDFRRDLSPLVDIRVVWRLFRLFSIRKPDVIQVMTLKPGILGAIAGRMAGVPLVIRHKWGYMRDCNYRGLKRFLLFSADKLSNILANRVVAVSHELKEAEIKAGAVKREKIVVYGSGTSHGIDIERFTLTAERIKQAKKIRQELQIPSRAIVLGTVMRINIEKGIGELVDAFSKLSKERQELHLVIVGAYDIRNRPLQDVTNVIETHPKIHHVGRQRYVENYYSAMDIFVLPTYREGFCNSNLEASSMELPVVSTTVIGVDRSSVIDNVTGLLVPPRNTIALREAIEKILDNPKLAHELGRNGRERVKREFANQLVWHHQLRDICSMLKAKGIKAPVEPEEISCTTCPLCAK